MGENDVRVYPAVRFWRRSCGGGAPSRIGIKVGPDQTSGPPYVRLVWTLCAVKGPGAAHPGINTLKLASNFILIYASVF